MKSYDLVGQKFNRLTVLRKIGAVNKKVLWECICDCGNVSNVRTNDLTSNRTLSCGCLNDERIANLNKSHEMTKTPLYEVWCGIKQRCEYKKHVAYKRYGGRGIKIANEWLDFKNFYNDMFSGYAKGLSIDRINVDGDYSKENCVWSNLLEQANNKRNNLMVTLDGDTDTLPNMCRKHGIKYMKAYWMHRCGKSIEEIIKHLKGG